MRFVVPIVAIILLASCNLQPVYRRSDAPLPVARIDIERYVGLWHEQARLPNSFERDCTAVTADYALRDDGLISVRNSCRDLKGSTRVANGRARVVGAEGEAKLKVSFAGPFWADYWVIERAEDYSWAIVGEPEGRYLWVLTRAAKIDQAQREFFQARVAALGYRPSDMVWAPI